VSYDLDNLDGPEHWYHIAVTWNKHGSLVDYNLYINGDLKDSETDKTWLDPGNYFYLGGGNAGNVQGKGKFDEVHIWDISKNEQEIREYIHIGNNYWTNGLLAKWQFNQSTGTIIPDLVNNYEATLNNMTDDDWVTSNISFGTGFVNSQVVSTTGSVVFDNTDLEMNFTEKNGTDTFVVSKINLAPNVLPTDPEDVFDDQYWIVNNYGNGTFETNITFQPAETISTWMQSNPDYLKLFKRNSNAIDDWSFAAAASSADASSNTVTFENITDFSQFIICGDVLPEITSTNPVDNEINRDWSSRVYIEFDEDITVGEGNVIIKKTSDNSVIADVPASSCTAINGKDVEINFGVQLEQLTSYYILIEDNAFKDIYGGYYNGIDDPNTWNFTTGETESIPGYAVEFDGIDDYENIGHHNSLDITGDITIECWIKPETHSDFARIIATPSTFDRKYIIALGDDEGEFAFASQPDGESQHKAISHLTNLNINEWNHIACVVDGTIIKLYINGTRIQSMMLTSSFTFTGTDVWLGMKQDGTNAFDGCIDELRIWNIVRSEDEIRENMCQTLSGNETGLVSYWQFNEGSGSIAKDWISGNNAEWRNPGRSGWVDSNIPFGIVTTVSHQFGETGVYDYSAADVSLEITSFTPDEEDSLKVAITRIDNAPNSIPDSIDYAYDDQYWVFTDDGNAFFNSNITFTLNEDLDEDDESFPNTVALYKRNTGSENGWIFYDRAIAVDAAANSVTFENINNFCQFIVAKNTNYPEPEGIAGNCLDFDGTDDYIEVSNENAFDFFNQFTVELWVYTESVGEETHYYTLMTKGIDDWTIDFLVDEGMYNYFYFYLPGIDSEIYAYVDSTEIYDKWNHLAFVYDGTSENDGYVAIYLNGEKSATSWAYGNLPSNANPVTIGKDQDDHQYYFDGKMDEVHIWRVARSQEQIRENMHRSLFGYESGLVSNFQFNESSGITASDVINGNNGTLMNMNNDDWVYSVIPFGVGDSDTQIVSTIGNVSFSDVGLEMDFSAKTGTDTLVVTRINTLSNINPTQPDEVFDAQYWVVNRFGDGTFETDLTFTITEDLTEEYESYPTQLKLYTRESNAYGDWEYITYASSVDLSENSVTFEGITEFSQFIIGRKNPPDRIPGTALDFDGTDDYVSIPLILPDDGTIEFWCYPYSFYNYNTLFDNSIDENDWEMWIYDTGFLKFRIENDGYVSYDLNNLFGANYWYHIALTWDKHNSLVDYDLYINGDLMDSETDMTWLDPGDFFYLGGGNSGNTSGNYKIDELRIWGDVRTETEIRESIHHPVTGVE
ncbi:MAG TPA: hypothetical protein ENL20_11815, partial [Candidatus Cloacimonetes bacterium]|nr:hypothetical protein [Candidatus Cloacimonadota bacterium]